MRSADAKGLERRTGPVELKEASALDARLSARDLGAMAPPEGLWTEG